MSDVIETVGDRGRRGRPSNLVRFMPGSGGSAFAIEKDIQGPVMMISAGSASAAFALGQAHLWVQGGLADVVVVGGAERPLHPDIVAPFVSAKILAPAGEPGRPLDQDRRGPSLGEGAGALVLESVAHARARGAEVLATVDGFGCATEACSLTSPDPAGRGVGRAVREALASAEAARPGSFPDGVGWIALHGTGTRMNDRAECESLRSVLGARFARTPLTALKSTVGHCLGAGAALEAVGAILAMRERFIPGIPTLRHVDPSLPPCDAVTETRDEPSASLLLLAESFGGRCVALAFGNVRNGRRRGLT
jgi:3-oxoacyl-(acyl-carrier-protein) synthase